MHLTLKLFWGNDMRPDQHEKLQDLSARLTDVFIGEAEPADWPGDGVIPREMDQQTRGDRYWCKKNAVATLAIVIRMQNLINFHAPKLNADEKAEGEETMLDAEIKAAEKEANRLLNKLQTGKRESKQTHGAA